MELLVSGNGRDATKGPRWLLAHAVAVFALVRNTRDTGDGILLRI